LPYQILRPSVIGGKMLSENNNFISKYMVLSFGKILSFYRTKENEQENVRFIINEDTGLNIIP
jgi:vacuolar-type H+-ATPase subunit C/Vma6